MVLGLDDEFGNLMTLELAAPNRMQARTREKAFGQKAEVLFQTVMSTLLQEPEEEASAE